MRRSPAATMSDHTPPTTLADPPSRPPLPPSGSPLRPLWLAAAFGVFLFLGWMLLASLWQPRLDWIALPGHYPRILACYGCLDAFALALSAAFLCGLEGRPFHTLGLSLAPGWLLDASVGMAWGAGVISVAAFFLFVSRAASFPPLASRSFSHFVFLSVFFLLSSSFEELTFRGYALQRAAVSFGPVAAALVSSALFGWAHLANPQATLLSSLNTALAGLLLAAARLRSRALWMPIGLHFAWNLFLGPVLEFPVSGYSFGAAGVIASPSRMAWLSGGAYGPEGGLVLTLVVAVAILLLIRFPLPSSSLRPPSDVDLPGTEG